MISDHVSNVKKDISVYSTFNGMSIATLQPSLFLSIAKFTFDIQIVRDPIGEHRSGAASILVTVDPIRHLRPLVLRFTRSYPYNNPSLGSFQVLRM